MPQTANWIEEMVPLPRPEYAKQTEALLTDLIWRSQGSNLSAHNNDGMLSSLSALSTAADYQSQVEPDRLVPRVRPGGKQKLNETFPIANSFVSGFIAGTPSPIDSLLESSLAPRARGDKSDACVPIHPAVVSLQTLQGLVNKQNPSNLSKAIETMAWLGGAPAIGHVAKSYLTLFDANTSDPRRGLAGFIDTIFPEIATHVWRGLPSATNASTPADWPQWPGVSPAANLPTVQLSQLAQLTTTPFSWFWRMWQTLCTPEWHEALPTRRFADWSLCLLRTGLAFSYIWEAEFFTRLHEGIVRRAQGNSPKDALKRLRSFLLEGTVLASVEPMSIPASQKDVWPALSELIARGYEARKAILEWPATEEVPMPTGVSISDTFENWLSSFSSDQLDTFTQRIETSKRTANNQKEFVRYLMLPRSSNDDGVDQADFYFLTRTNSSRSVWLHPGPEWLVVLASLLCQKPGGSCTLGQLLKDLTSLGIQVERSVLVELLEQAGLSTDSPDADNAIVIRSGF